MTPEELQALRQKIEKSKLGKIYSGDSSENPNNPNHENEKFISTSKGESENPFHRPISQPEKGNYPRLNDLRAFHDWQKKAYENQDAPRINGFQSGINPYTRYYEGLKKNTEAPTTEIQPSESKGENERVTKPELKGNYGQNSTQENTQTHKSETQKEISPYWRSRLNNLKNRGSGEVNQSSDTNSQGESQGNQQEGKSEIPASKPANVENSQAEKAIAPQESGKQQELINRYCVQPPQSEQQQPTSDGNEFQGKG